MKREMTERSKKQRRGAEMNLGIADEMGKEEYVGCDVERRLREVLKKGVLRLPM